MPERSTGDPARSAGIHKSIHRIVRLIPPGRVATYGQIAAFAGRCTPRMVGYAMAAIPSGSDVPWHRVINSRGTISLRSSSVCSSRRASFSMSGGGSTWSDSGGPGRA